jgi:hypothetical protein
MYVDYAACLSELTANVFVVWKKEQSADVAKMGEG